MQERQFEGRLTMVDYYYRFESACGANVRF